MRSTPRLFAGAEVGDKVLRLRRVGTSLAAYDEPVIAKITHNEITTEDGLKYSTGTGFYLGRFAPGIEGVRIMPSREAWEAECEERRLEKDIAKRFSTGYANPPLSLNALRSVERVIAADDIGSVLEHGMKGITVKGANPEHRHPCMGCSGTAIIVIEARYHKTFTQLHLCGDCGQQVLNGMTP